jgi:hypothetical protein
VICREDIAATLLRSSPTPWGRVFDFGDFAMLDPHCFERVCKHKTSVWLKRSVTNYRRLSALPLQTSNATKPASALLIAVLLTGMLATRLKG